MLHAQPSKTESGGTRPELGTAPERANELAGSDEKRRGPSIRAPFPVGCASGSVALARDDRVGGWHG